MEVGWSRERAGSGQVLTRTKSMEGVWQIHPGNDDVASSRHPSNKLQRCHCQEWLLYHLGCLNDDPYSVASPSQASAERSNIISGMATSGCMSTTRPTSPSQQLFLRVMEETYFVMCIIFPSPTVYSISFHRAVFYLGPRPGQLGNDGGRMKKLSHETFRGW
jgi:hypothetical protein